MTIYQLHIECHSCRQGNHNACSSNNKGYVVRICCTCSICSHKKDDDNISDGQAKLANMYEMSNNSLQPVKVRGHSLIAAIFSNAPTSDDGILQ